MQTAKLVKQFILTCVCCLSVICVACGAFTAQERMAEINLGKEIVTAGVNVGQRITIQVAQKERFSLPGWKNVERFVKYAPYPAGNLYDLTENIKMLAKGNF